LTSLVIGEGVVSIGKGAFRGNLLRCVIIHAGANVSYNYEQGAFASQLGGVEFRKYYEKNGKKAGYYTCQEWQVFTVSTTKWSYSSQPVAIPEWHVSPAVRNAGGRAIGQ